MSTVLEALAAEKAGYVARGDKGRADQVQAQIDALTGAASQRAAAPVAKRGPSGRQTRKG